MHAYVEIIRADGRADVRPLEAEQITIGSGLDATIPISDAPELESVHLLLAPRDGGCWVSVAEGVEAAAWVSGKIHENGMLQWGTEIDVGSITLRINHAVVEEQKRRARRRRLTIIASLAGTLLVGTWLMRDETDSLPRRTAEPPVLFDDLPSACPVNDVTRALARAEAAREEANARIVRYPFDAQDGIEAVHKLTVAEHCLARAGRPSDVESIRTERDRVKARLEEDYQVHLLRLSQVLGQRRMTEALSEARALHKLLEHKTGPYRDWLIRLQRHIEVKLERNGIKRRR